MKVLLENNFICESDIESANSGVIHGHKKTNW